MRQITRAPGAARATFSTSASQSTANSVMPSLCAVGDLALLLDRVAVGDAVRGAPAASTLSVSLIEATSKHEPSSVSSLEDLRRRIGLHGVEHARVGQRLGEGVIVLAHDVDVDHEAGPFVLAVLQEFADACGHSTPFPCPVMRGTAAA